MTQVSYSDSAAGFFITLKGHSDYAPRGQDIVCAGISVLSSALMLACERARHSGEIENLRMELDDGFVHIAFAYRKPISIKRIVVLITDCLKNIESEYPQNLRVSQIKSQAKQCYHCK